MASAKAGTHWPDQTKAIWIGDGALIHAVVGGLVDEGSGLHV